LKPILILLDLPVPKLSSITPKAIPSRAQLLAARPPQRPATPPAATTGVSVPPQKPRNMRKDSLEFPDADPWGSPAMHRGHNHEPNSPAANGDSTSSRNGVHEPTRTT